MYTEFTKKKVFGQLTLAVAAPARRCRGRQKVLIPECDLTDRRVVVDRSSSLPVRLHVVLSLLSVLKMGILMLV